MIKNNFHILILYTHILPKLKFMKFDLIIKQVNSLYIKLLFLYRISILYLNMLNIILLSIKNSQLFDLNNIESFVYLYVFYYSKTFL